MNNRRYVHHLMRATGRPQSHHRSEKRTHLVRWCVLGGRYSRAISSINDLLTLWHPMSYEKKASRVEYSRFIRDGEDIINDERRSWQTTGIMWDGSSVGKKERVPSKVTELVNLFVGK